VQDSSGVELLQGKGGPVTVPSGSITSVPISISFDLSKVPKDTLNRLIAVNVLESARKAKTDPAFIFCSTNKVYVDNVNRIPIEENSSSYSFADDRNRVAEHFPIARTGHTPYGSSKLAADIYVQDYAHTYGLKTIVFRMSCVYGTRQFGVEDQGWVAWLTIASILGKKIRIYGNGKQVRDVMFVDDLMKAFDSAIRNSKKLQGEAFNIGGGPKNTLSLLELLRMLRRKVRNGPEVEFSDWRPHDQRVYISDISKAKERLHWEPKINPETGVSRLAQWVQTNRKLFT
jgi:CDP-paratose 2-epimerase